MYFNTNEAIHNNVGCYNRCIIHDYNNNSYVDVQLYM